MGLLKNINSGGGLFAFDPDTQQAVDQYAAMPPGPVEQKRGGFLGSGYDGEDIMSMLLRAAVIAQGDLGAGAQFGANIGAKARAEAEAAAAERQHQQRRMEGRADKQWEWGAKPRDLTEFERSLVAEGLTPGSSEYQARLGQYNQNRADPRITTMLPGDRFYSGPGSKLPQAMGGAQGGGGIPQQAIDELRSGKGSAAQFDEIFGAGASAQYLGGGVRNGPGGFPPRR